jgi:hypothetical protein
MDRTKEVTFEVGGRALTMRNTLKTLKRFQRAFDHTDANGVTHIADLIEVQRFLREGSLEHVIAFLWAALQDRHAAEFPTVDHVDELYAEHEAVVASAFLELCGMGKVDPKDLEELARQMRGDPPAAQVDDTSGTGEVSRLPVSPAA